MRTIPALVVALFLVPALAAGRDLRVRSGSVVRYVAQEDRFGHAVTIVGTNGEVRGTVAWSDSAGHAVLPATITIDATAFRSGIGLRDHRVASILEGKTHPITFTIESSEPPLAKPLPAKAAVKGSLSAHGTAKSLSIPVAIATHGALVAVDGSTGALTYGDFGMTPPTVPFVARARDTLTFTFHLELEAP